MSEPVAARRMVGDLLAVGQHFGLVKLAVAALAVVDDDGSPVSLTMRMLL